MWYHHREKVKIAQVREEWVGLAALIDGNVMLVVWTN